MMHTLDIHQHCTLGNQLLTFMIKYVVTEE
jgi:hypothetical protein